MLDSTNDDARGVTTDATSVWTVDRNDKRVYKYSMSGSLQTSWALTSANNDPRDITTDGSTLWVVDRQSRKVFHYSLTGSLLDSFDLFLFNPDAEGITTDGEYIWVLDRTFKLVYKYGLTGRLLSAFALTAANADSRGITVNGSTIWAVDKTNNKVYRYNTNGSFFGSFLDSFDLATGNNDAEGITYITTLLPPPTATPLPTATPTHTPTPVPPVAGTISYTVTTQHINVPGQVANVKIVWRGKVNASGVVIRLFVQTSSSGFPAVPFAVFDGPTQDATYVFALTPSVVNYIRSQGMATIKVEASSLTTFDLSTDYIGIVVYDP